MFTGKLMLHDNSLFLSIVVFDHYYFSPLLLLTSVLALNALHDLFFGTPSASASGDRTQNRVSVVYRDLSKGNGVVRCQDVLKWYLTQRSRR